MQVCEEPAAHLIKHGAGGQPGREERQRCLAVCFGLQEEACAVESGHESYRVCVCCSIPGDVWHPSGWVIRPNFIHIYVFLKETTNTDA